MNPEDKAMKHHGKDTTSNLRRNAEERLAKEGSHPKVDDPLKLIHELQVHQIELEMQNEELMQARAEIEAGLEKYSILYDFAPVGYFTLTDDGTIQDVNLTGASLLGDERAHLIKQHFSVFLSHEAHPAFVEFLGKVFKDTTKKTCEAMLSGNTDNPRYVHIEGIAIRTGKDLGWHCLMAVMDITDRKRSEAEEERLKAQLSQTQKVETIGTFAGGIAHDFNNILAAIFGYAELALVEANRPDLDKVRKNLNGVLQAGKRAKDLVTQILSFSRHDEMEYKPIMLYSTIKESLRMLRAIIPESIEFRQNLHSSGMVLADPIQIHQLMMKLCSNAAQAIGRTEGVVQVSLKDVTVDETAAMQSLTLNPGDYVKLTVSDTGHGMTPEVMARIFEPYFTTKGIGSGSGLGLSVVQGIVKKHKGAITVESEPGKGTTFNIYLPRVEFKKEPEASPVEITLLTGTERVLFVDDEPVLVDLAKQALESLGYEVTATTSSTEALEVFKKNPDRFDLVITDMTMPDMMGDRLAQRILEARHDIPIILCSGYGEHISTKKLKGIGIHEYIMKPFVLSDLAKTIRKSLDKPQK